MKLYLYIGHRLIVQNIKTKEYLEVGSANIHSIICWLVFLKMCYLYWFDQKGQFWVLTFFTEVSFEKPLKILQTLKLQHDRYIWDGEEWGFSQNILGGNVLNLE